MLPYLNSHDLLHFSNYLGKANRTVDRFHSNTQKWWNFEFSSFFSPTSGMDIDVLLLWSGSGDQEALCMTLMAIKSPSFRKTYLPSLVSVQMILCPHTFCTVYPESNCQALTIMDRHE